jgi:hypothetical protein
MEWSACIEVGIVTSEYSWKCTYEYMGLIFERRFGMRGITMRQQLSHDYTIGIFFDV